MDLKLLKAKVDLLTNIKFFSSGIVKLKQLPQSESNVKKILHSKFIVQSNSEILLLITEMNEKIELYEKNYSSLQIECMKLKQELMNLKPKPNDNKNIESNLRTIKIGNTYFDVRS